MSDIKKASKLDRKELFQLIILFLLLMLTCSNFYYSDVNSNIRQGINVWKALFTGNFFNYYSVNIESFNNGEMIHYANYDMIMNFLMGIMGLPLYIVECIFKINVQDYLLGRIIAKSIYPFMIMLASDFLRGTVREMIGGVKDIYSEEIKKRANNAAFMFASSIFVISSTCVMTQADIFGIIFIILSVKYLNRHDLKRFMIFFILAASCKNFALFIFMPVLMLIEKNLFKLFAMLLSPLVVNSLIEMPFKLIDPAGSLSKKSRLWSMFGTMCDTKVPLWGVEIPVIFLLFGGVCIFAFVHKSPDFVNNRLHAIRLYLFFSLASLTAFFMSMRIYAYWIIYFAPFIVLIITLSNYIHDNEIENQNTDMTSKIFTDYFLEIFAAFGLTAGFMVKYYSHFNIDIAAVMLPGLFTGVTDVSGFTDLYTFNQFVTNDVYYNMWTVGYGVFTLFCIYLLISNYPKDNKLSLNPDIKMTDSIFIGVNKIGINLSYRSLLWIRAIAGLIFCNIAVILYFIQC